MIKEVRESIMTISVKQRISIKRKLSENKKLSGNSEFEKYEMKNSLERLSDRLELAEELTHLQLD